MANEERGHYDPGNKRMALTFRSMKAGLEIDSFYLNSSCWKTYHSSRRSRSFGLGID